jgi:hypothetical protein
VLIESRGAHRRFMETSEEPSSALVADCGSASNAAHPADLAARIRLFAA